MEISFENDFQKKVMIQTFSKNCKIDSIEDIKTWKSLWMKGLSSWHSPYKCLLLFPENTKIDFKSLNSEITTLVKFFKGFFLIKLVAVIPNYSPSEDQEELPFDIVATTEEANKKIGYRQAPLPKSGENLRSQIIIENHFKQQVVEISFSGPVSFDKSSDIDILKAKLVNNLMQWHSPWNLLIDCQNMALSEDTKDDFSKLIKYLNGFFLKGLVGYSIKGDSTSFPFKIYRSRHKAVAQLEAEGHFSGDKADCASRMNK